MFPGALVGHHWTATTKLFAKCGYLRHIRMYAHKTRNKFREKKIPQHTGSVAVSKFKEHSGFFLVFLFCSFKRSINCWLHIWARYNRELPTIKGIGGGGGVTERGSGKDDFKNEYNAQKDNLYQVLGNCTKRSVDFFPWKQFSAACCKTVKKVYSTKRPILEIRRSELFREGFYDRVYYTLFFFFFFYTLTFFAQLDFVKHSSRDSYNGKKFGEH